MSERWKDIREVYPDAQDKYGFCAPANYDPLLESFGYEILLQVDDKDYQGDSRVLYRDGTRYGLLIFGWGSCSGCDALQACGSYEEIEELRKELHDGIRWFDSAEEALKYFEEHDWEGDFYWNDDETKRFINEGIALLRKEVKA